MAYKYSPILRARQQEILVLQQFDFGDQMLPLIEIIKEKDRKDNKDDGDVIYTELVNNIKATKVMVDLPIYLEPTVSTAEEVKKFFFSTISVLTNRIQYYKSFTELVPKFIPVISILQPYSDEADTLIKQFQELKDLFPIIGIRIYFNTFDRALVEMKKAGIRAGDILIYDLDTVNITSPIIKKHKGELDNAFADCFKIVVRSAINTDIQNVKLQHEQIIGEADNSLKEYFNTMLHFPAFGDYAGVKKDDITSGGTISPGFIFYNPDDNLYYGFKGHTKQLSEFETTIVPAVLNAAFVKEWVTADSNLIKGNAGYDRLLKINSKAETGKNQAKFKWISMMHYLHCIKSLLDAGTL